MKVLAVCVRVPEQGKKGDQVLSFHRLKYLSRNHTITLICFGSYASDAKAVENLSLLGITVKLIAWSNLIAIKNALTNVFFSSLPFQCALFKCATFAKAVKQCLKDFEPDVVYAVMIRVLINLPDNKLPLFIDMIDSMGLNFSRRMAIESGLKKYALGIEFKRIRSYEISAAKTADLSFVVSRVDQKFIDSSKVKALPLGIDKLQLSDEILDHHPRSIVFSGNMNYEPNIDAVLWFNEHCWRKIKEAFPDLLWVIAGSNPSNEILALKSDKNIKVTGRVPSLTSVIRTAILSIAPMQSGSGMQFKILEAMSCGVPVVSTSLGLGDISAIPDQDVVIADSSDSFTQAIFDLLSSPHRSEIIGENGRKFVNVNHSWDMLNAEFEANTFAKLSLQKRL
jgi:glycosyltransferase involved in cell wall biosynthesis